LPYEGFVSSARFLGRNLTSLGFCRGLTSFFSTGSFIPTNPRVWPRSVIEISLPDWCFQAGSVTFCAGSWGEQNRRTKLRTITAEPDPDHPPEKVAFAFDGRDGDAPVSGVILVGTHTLYGTTAYGGVDGKGVVFELTSSPNQLWKETLLHAFAGSQDGSTPFGDLLADGDGNLYGTTRYGPGPGHSSGSGIVFKLNRKDDWSEKKLYEFAGAPDGADPYAGLTSDGHGNFYGTAFNGGNTNSNCWQGSCGTVFMLSPQTSGGFTEKLLHTFCSGSCRDGGNPKAGVIFDKRGNLYGTTIRNAGSKGTIFQLSPNSDGTWTETVIHTFHDSHGDDPDGGLLFDQKGNLYGATDVGGIVESDCPAGCGTVYKLSPKSAGAWTESVLHYFGRAGDGNHPRRNLIMDKAGNLYGVTPTGGQYGQGTVFKITP